MNARYNTKCAPAQDGQLYSICLADQGCSLAAPKADCAAYANVKPYGTEDTSTVTPLASQSATSSSSPPSTSSSTSLGGGAIAGIAVGAAAGIALLAGSVWFFLKKCRDGNNPATQPQSLAVSQMAFDGGSYHRDPGMHSPQMSQDGYYNMNRQSQFTASYPAQGYESPYMSPPAGSLSPGHGWTMTETKPQELDSSDARWTPASPTVEIKMQSVVGSLNATPEIRELAEMESPQRVNWGPQTIHEGAGTSNRCHKADRCRFFF